jgi:hypothetical protein
MSFVVKRIATDVLLFFTEFCLYIINRKIHGCLEIQELFLVLNMISHSFAALTREISCSTLEINLVFPRTHVLFSISLISEHNQYFSNFQLCRKNEISITMQNLPNIG